MSINCPACGQIDLVQKVEAIVLAGNMSGANVSSTVSRGVSYGSGNVVLADGSSVSRQAVHLESELSRLLAPPKLEEFGGAQPEWVPISRPVDGFTTTMVVGPAVVLTLVFSCYPIYSILTSFPGWVTSMAEIGWEKSGSNVLLTLFVILLVAFSSYLCFRYLRWTLSKTLLAPRIDKRDVAAQEKERVENTRRWEESRDAAYRAGIHRWAGLYYCARDHGVFDPAVKKFMRLGEMRQYILTGK